MPTAVIVTPDDLPTIKSVITFAFDCMLPLTTTEVNVPTLVIFPCALAVTVSAIKALAT